MEGSNHGVLGIAESIVRSLLASGLSWGTADLAFAGQKRSSERAGELAAFFTALTHGGEPAFSAVFIVWPSHGDETAQITADIKAAFTTTRTAHSPVPLEATSIDVEFARVHIVRPTSLELDALRATLESVSAHSAIVIVHAARYREPTVVPRIVVRPEDAWAPHLRALLTHVMAVGVTRKTYTVVDVGHELPPDGDAKSLLFSVDGCGVFGGETPSYYLSPEMLARWNGMAEGGELDAALRELSDIDDLSEVTALLVKVRLLHAAGIQAAAVSALIEARPTLSALSPSEALSVAQQAAMVGARDLAAEVLAQAIAELEEADALETAMLVANSVGRAVLTRSIATRLSQRYPRSLPLGRYHAAQQIEAGAYVEAARTLREIAEVDSTNADAADDADFWESIAHHAPAPRERMSDGPVEAFDAPQFVSIVTASHADRDHVARDLAASILEREARYRDAALLLLDAPHVADERVEDATCLALLSLLERARLARDTTIDDELLHAVLGRVIGALALRPRSEALRSRLLHLLEPQLLGTRGLAVLAVYLMRKLAKEGDVIVVAEPPPPTHGLEEMPTLFRKTLEWLSAQPALVIGQVQLPAEVLTMPADDAVALYEQMIRHQVDEPATAAGARDAQPLLIVAMATALHGSRSDYDLVVLREAATRIARTSRVQFARDLAESALHAANGIPRRLRLAWAAYADVHHRLGTFSEALLAVCCALAADDTVYSDQRRHESALVFRLLRDVGLGWLVSPLQKRLSDEWGRVDAAALGAVRNETMRLQLAATALLQNGGADPRQLAALLPQSIANVREVLAVGDEIAPAASLLASVLRFAEEAQIDVSADADELLRDAIRSLREPMRQRILLARSSHPTLHDVVEFAATLDYARYADDVGVDVNELASYARRLLKPSAAGDATTAWYAVEAQSDLAITMPHTVIPLGVEQYDDSATEGSLALTSQRLIDTADGPITAARELATADLSVVGLTLVGDQLARVTATPAGSSAPVIESSAHFLAQRLREWGREFPYGYGDTGATNVLFTSTEGIGVSALPIRAVVVGSIGLQSFPPNLLNIDNKFAGAAHRLAMAPSLSWLQSARRAPFGGDGRRHAWVPTAEPDEGVGTLATLAGRLGESLSEHSVELHTGGHLPDGLAGSELVIVGAHGGVAERNRYFLSVQDDVSLRVPSGSVARALGGIGVVVLFVCSGGRVDRRPGASAMLGLAKELLDRGCRAVVAPPWPLEALVPPLWLPTFLQVWSAGHPVIDAVFEANMAVRQSGGAEPARYLAMNVYGDPLTAAVRR